MVTVPSLPGIVTQADSEDEALAMAKEAIECHIEGLLLDGEPVPEEGTTVPPQTGGLTEAHAFRVTVQVPSEAEAVA